MSDFANALDLVIGRLQDRRGGGAVGWRATRSSLARLLEQPAPAPKAAPSFVEALPPSRPAPENHAPLQSTGAPAITLAGQNYEPITDPALSKAERLIQLRACRERLPCPLCPYGRGEHPHVVFGVGNIDTELMFIGEAPGAEEDAVGEPFVGRAGQLLNKMIVTMGYQRSDIYIANILKCRPDTPGQTSGNRAPTSAEMESCRPCLYEQIDIIRPRALIALGATAMRGLLDVAEPIGKLRGHWHEFRGIPVMATYHPSYLLRNQAPAERRKVWEDLLEVKARLGHVITDRDRSYFLTKS